MKKINYLKAMYTRQFLLQLAISDIEPCSVKSSQSKILSIACPTVYTHKISQLAKKMCSHCLFRVVDKSGTSCYHLVNKVDEANRLATSCSNKSDIVCT